MVLFSSCHEHDGKKPHYTSDSDHTLLIYIEGDNTLSTFAQTNIESCKEGLLQSDNPINLVIYKDNRSAGDGLPVLFQLKKSPKAAKIDTIYIKRWEADHNSASPAIMAEIIDLTFRTFDTPVKGIDFWSHGMSWIPSSAWASSSVNRAPAYIGQDNGDYMEIWQLREALEQSQVHPDYLIFDACHMATAEVAYELRNCADWMVASETEIMGEGFPYAAIMQSLSKSNDLFTTLQMTVNDYQEAYYDNGSCSLIRLSGMEELRKAFRNCNFPAEWSTIEEEYSLQHYGRKRTGARYYFYNLAEVCRDDSMVMEALNYVVVNSYASSYFSDGIEGLRISKDCGLAISLPQFFYMSADCENLKKAYPLLEWNK